MTNEEFVKTLEDAFEIVRNKQPPDKFFDFLPYWVYKEFSKEEWAKFLKELQMQYLIKIEVIFIKDFTKNIRYKLTEKGELERLYI